MVRISPHFLANTFISNAKMKLAKNKTNAEHTLRLNCSQLIIIQILHPRYHPEIINHILKTKQKTKRVFIHEIIWLIIMKMKMKMKNRSLR